MAKERLRADREGSSFGLVILLIRDLDDVRRQTVALAKILHRRLRQTDEKGHLGCGRIGIVLPATDEEGAQLVMDDLLRLAAKARLPLDGEYFVYPERPGGGMRFDSEHDSGRGRRSSELAKNEGKSPSPKAVAVDRRSRTKFSAERSFPIGLVAKPYPMWKRSLDMLGASFGLLLASPIIAAAAVMIRITSPGPVFFAQDRIGQYGRRFRIYKLRTMVQNAEELKAGLRDRNERDGPAFKMVSDPRITSVGRFLRSTGLDELPQLLNVLNGDMALVGPRPLPVDEDAQCELWHRSRLDTKPGLTCYWQIAKTRKMSFTEWMRLDMRYARRRSAWLDIQLLMKTVSAVVLGRVGH